MEPATPQMQRSRSFTDLLKSPFSQEDGDASPRPRRRRSATTVSRKVPRAHLLVAVLVSCCGSPQDLLRAAAPAAACPADVPADAVAVEFTAPPTTKSTSRAAFVDDDRAAFDDEDRPKMPERVRASIYRDWEPRDPGATEAIRKLRRSPAFVEFPHARDTFANHLESTYAILQAWDQPSRVCRAGLVHTAYSGDLFSFFAYDAKLSSERARLADLIGEEAEPLVHLFGTIARHEFVGLGKMMENRTTDAATPLTNELVRARSRLGPDVELEPSVVAELVVVTIADYVDQTLDVNGWRDHHMVDPIDTPLFPGDMRPSACLYWIAAACKAVREHLVIVPPVFDGCTASFTYEDEEQARELYWAVVQNRTDLGGDAGAGAMLAEAAALNPHVGEVDALAAQLHFRNGRYLSAKRLAASALRKLYAMGGTWDKRLSYEAWVGFCRLLIVRAEADGELPRAPGDHNVNDLGVRLVPIKTAVELMP